MKKVKALFDCFDLSEKDKIRIARGTKWGYGGSEMKKSNLVKRLKGWIKSHEHILCSDDINDINDIANELTERLN